MVSGISHLPACLFSEYRKTAKIRFGRFAVRRAIKIYPAFWVLVLVTVAVKAGRHPISIGDDIRQQVLHDLFFAQSYLPGTWGHFWSLSIEEHFYILLPLTMFILLRAARRRPDRNPFTGNSEIVPGRCTGATDRAPDHRPLHALLLADEPVPNAPAAGLATFRRGDRVLLSFFMASALRILRRAAESPSFARPQFYWRRCFW